MNPHWESIVLIDAQRREEIFDLRRPLGEPVSIPNVHEGALRRLLTSGTSMVGDIESHEHPVVWLYVPVRNEGKLTHVIAASLKPRIFQDLLTAYAAPGSTAGIVDADGDFVARTLDYPQRVGTPATQYVRDAVRGGTSGLYSGTTYEGLNNYTAYNVSGMSGWSTHLAVASASIDTPLAGRSSRGHRRARRPGARWVYSSYSWCATWRSDDARKTCCVSRRRWRRSASSPAASRTTSTTC